MAVVEKIDQYVRLLPESTQAEVLDFVEFLLEKSERPPSRQEEREWSRLSLAFAMRGMEDEDSPSYTPADLQERYS